MNKPPNTIDGAKVIEWAWSGNTPFGVLEFSDGKVAAKIYGLAICQYEGSSLIYRFSCNNNWEAEQDGDYSTLEEAKRELPEQYTNIEAHWIKYEQNT